MNTDRTLQYLDSQRRQIQAVIKQLDEIQVVFNAQFDEFKAQHDAKLDELTELVADHLDAIAPSLGSAIDARLPEEREHLEARRQKVRDEYLPQRQEAADELLQQAQAELAELRKLNPELDALEERLKREKGELEAQLAALNDEIRQKSRGLRFIRHLLAIFRADRERQRIIGRLEKINEDLRRVRQAWERKRTQIEEHQAELQNEWQLESMAVARLQAELDRLDDQARREDLALRRAARHVLDNLDEPASSTDPGIERGLQEMVTLNHQTDEYHRGLASVGGLIGLLHGIRSGLSAIRKSVEGIGREYQMHKAYLQAPSFSLPARAEALDNQWSRLAHQFAEEEVIGQHPAAFAAAVEPIVAGPLSQANIERTFEDLGRMIEGATARW